MAGEPLMIGETTLTPESSVLVIRFPGLTEGGFVWARPAAVIIRRGEQVERVPIVDVTRMAQIGLWLGTAVLAFILSILLARRKEQSK
jgi:hypothetical protein